MTIRIRTRIDSEEFYTTETTILTDVMWQDVLAEIESIECHNTVLSVERVEKTGVGYIPV